MPFKRIERRVAGLRAPVALKLQLAFLLVIGVLLVTGVVSLFAIASIRNQATDLERLDAAVLLALGLDHSILLQEHLSSMLLLTEEEAYSAKLVAEQGRFRAVLSRLNSQGGTVDEVAAMEQAFARYEGAADMVRQLRRAGDQRQAQHVHVAQEHTIAHQIEELTKALVARMKTLKQDKHQEILTAQRWTTWTVGGFFLFSVALALTLGSVLARSILYPVSQVDTALSRIAGGEFVTVEGVNNRDELGSLVANVNRMSHQLADLYAMERQTAQTLQEQFAALDHTQGQLRQAQKMEAVGRLAGGVAHDFNNLLTVIGGRANLLEAKLGADHPMRRNVELICRTADRATALTRQLLAFSRKQVLQPRVLDLKGLIEGIVPMLQRLIGEDITLRTALGRGTGSVKADPTQLEQVVLNLVVNARDAMPRGGTLTIEVGNGAAGGIDGQESAIAGPGVTLVVRDTGVGIAPEIQPHLFEPFFTTKAPGKGTGLGLATVYGIVKQSGGQIEITSAPGQGTAVTVWLPRTEARPDAGATSGRDGAAFQGRETVLLVEDEADIRDFVGEVLQGRGYTVLEAQDGEDALRVVEQHREPLDLVLTDVVMPKLGGRDLVTRLTARHPRLSVLYMSGYTDDTLGERGVLERGASLLHKPFTSEQLVSKVRRVLDGAARGPRSLTPVGPAT